MGTKIQTKRILKGFSSTSNIIHTMDLGAKRGRSYGFPLCTTMAPPQVPHTLLECAGSSSILFMFTNHFDKFRPIVVPQE